MLYYDQMSRKIYNFDAKFTKDNHPNLGKVKVQGDRWCKHHCSDLHQSKMLFDDIEEKQYVVFQFRSESDLTAFRIGFDVYDF